MTVDYKKFGLRYKEILAELRATADFDKFLERTLSLDMALEKSRRADPYDYDLAFKILIEKQRLINGLIEKFHLPPPFRIILENPFNPDANGLFFAPYRIDPQTIPVEKGEFEKPRIAGKSLDELTVTIYGRLSTEDWKTLKERIERLQDIAFDSEAIRPFRRSKNIDGKVKVVKEMATRKPKRVHEEVVQHNYMAILMKQNNKELSTSEKRRLAKLNPRSVQKVIEKGRSSADVAAQLGRRSKGKDKGAAVRKTLSRYKNAKKRVKTP
jgi:hypothetical protein